MPLLQIQDANAGFCLIADYCLKLMLPKCNMLHTFKIIMLSVNVAALQNKGKAGQASAI